GRQTVKADLGRSGGGSSSGGGGTTHRRGAGDARQSGENSDNNANGSRRGSKRGRGGGGKVAGADKKLYRFLENKFQDDLEEAKNLSPEQSSLTNIVSPFGPLTQSASRKTLFYLIATLNASFPDYDFRYVYFQV
ncbi:RNA polymerase III-inhibiting protein maf1, partial [Coemansia sp. S155-1]